MADKKEMGSDQISESPNDAKVAPLAASPGSDVAKDAETKGSRVPLATEELPSPETCRKVGELQVLDREGKAHAFKSLYEDSGSAERVVVIFVRHFFCGSCQEYVISLSQAIRPDDLLQLPTSTSIAIVGCGDPGLIDFYATETGCPFPIYADPTRKLYENFGMSTTLALGAQPEYIRKSLLRIVGEGFMQILKQIPSGLAHKGGQSSQNGGEIIYESNGEERQKKMTWFHKMKTTRDHIEIKELISLLDPEGNHLQKPRK